MAKLLIVDDERTTRESLTRYIPWDRLGIGPVRAARNGAEALSLAAHDSPDLLITDVRMPKMDGIALAERVRELYPACKIIFLSGYADKEYLKKAIALRAVGYIEKPIDPAEVEEVARTALSLHEEEARSRAALATGVRSYDEVVRGLIRCDTGGPLPSFPPDCVITVAALAMRWDHGRTFSECDAARLRILGSVRSLPASVGLRCFVGFTETDVLAVVAAARLSEVSRKARAFFSALLEELDRLGIEGVRFSLGVGTPVTGAANIPRSYESALEAAELSFYRGFGKALYLSEGRAERFFLDREELTRLRETLRDNDGASAVLLVNTLVDRARSEEPRDVDSVRNALFDVLLVVFEEARATRGLDPFGDSERTYVWQEIHERSSLEELRELACGNIEAIFVDGAPRIRASRSVTEIQRYIREHYANPGISLQTIADHARLSRTYVSFLFKSITGENIGDYITRLRIVRAKELLADPAIRAGEVASRVGYADANYFSTAFRRHVGMSPSEYRDRPSRTP